MHIKLINPCAQWDLRRSSAETFKIQHLALPLLAAYTPSEHTVTIVDESFAPDDADQEADLVGITVMTDLARRAYQIADAYRQRRVPVVLGGVHPTVMPNEALQHADAIVLGEGEVIWPKLLSDLTRGKLTKVYKSERTACMAGRPIPRHDLYPGSNSKGYTPLCYAVEASRGCPYDCEFCTVAMVMGRKYRFRPPREVAYEISYLDNPNIFFVDDNFGMNRKVAKELFTELIPLNCVWIGQGTVSLAEDIELLRLMKRSGCHAMLIGFESVQEESRNTMSKVNNMKIDYKEAMRRFHGEGIAVLGAFVFGFDYENKDIFEQTLDFALENKLDLAQLRSLIPFPGTKFYKRLQDEGRLFIPDWWLREAEPGGLLFRPKGMTPDEFLGGLERISKEFYSFNKIFHRSMGMKPWRRSKLGWKLYIGTNLAFRRRLYNIGLSVDF
jgi:radical SAM superfamily enzyme YgiQ (UPF0313 family)